MRNSALNFHFRGFKLLQMCISFTNQCLLFRGYVFNRKKKRYKLQSSALKPLIWVNTKSEFFRSFLNQLSVIAKQDTYFKLEYKKCNLWSNEWRQLSCFEFEIVISTLYFSIVVSILMNHRRDKETEKKLRCLMYQLEHIWEL